MRHLIAIREGGETGPGHPDRGWSLVVHLSTQPVLRQVVPNNGGNGEDGAVVSGVFPPPVTHDWHLRLHLLERFQEYRQAAVVIPGGLALFGSAAEGAGGELQVWNKPKYKPIGSILPGLLVQIG